MDTPSKSEDDAQLTEPVTREELVKLWADLNHDIQQIIDTFNATIQQLFTNQQAFNSMLESLSNRVGTLEDPSVPRIYIPK